MVSFVFNDGGREAAGYKGKTRDCVCRAISIATEMSYADVYYILNMAAARERTSKRRKAKSSARTGVHIPTIRRVMAELGWRWVPCMTIGSGCQVHLKASELPSGRIVVKLSRHIATVIDGVLHDTYDSSQAGTRCVYGYWTKS